MRVVSFDCKECARRAEIHLCVYCGLDGPLIYRFRKMLPATEEHLKNEFPSWTGKGTISQ